MRKGIAAATLSFVIAASSVLPVCAAPITMPDGNVFDPEYYAEQNPDVAAALGTDTQTLYLHYLYCGKQEGRAPYATDVMIGEFVLPDGNVFDPEYYAAHNPDVVAVVGTSEAALYQHYLNFGRLEGRRPCASGAESASTYVPSSYDYARIVLDEIGWDPKAAFDWSASMKYYGHGKPDMPENGSPGTNWFALFGFTKNKGNCYVMAATFCQMARLMGYDAQQVSGQVPARSGGLTPHSWVEVYIDGQTYVCDPDFTYGTKRNGFMIQYRQPGTWMYTNYSPMSD